MALELDINECAKTVGETIDNDTFFGVYEDFDTMISIIKAANLDAKQGIYIIKGSKSQNFSSKDMLQVFKSINVHFDSCSEEGIDNYFDFIESAYKTLKAKPLKAIYNFSNDICNARIDLQADFSKLQTDYSKLQTDYSNLQKDYSNLQADYSNLQADKAKFLSEQTKLNSEMNPTIKYLESDVSRLKQENSSILSEKNKLQNDISDRDNRIASLQKEIYNLKDENNKISSQIRSKENVLSSIIDAMTHKSFDEIYSLLDDFSSKGDKSIIKAFCRVGLSEVRNSYEITPLLRASGNGNLRLVKSLIEGGCNRDAISNAGNNALLIASYEGETDVVRYLISSAGFNKNWRNKDGFTAILNASNGGHIDTVKYLVSIGCDVNSETDKGANCSYLATVHGNIELLKYIISCGGSIKGKVSGFTCLHGAAQGNKVNAIEYLLSRGLNINETSKYGGYTPLHAAVLTNNFESVEYLIKRGAKLNMRDNDNDTPLDIAKSKGFTKIRDILIKAGAR